MSVSLREILGTLQDESIACKSIQEINSLRDKAEKEIKALFPPQLTEEEVEKKECEHQWGIHCLTSYPPTFIYKCELCGEHQPKCEHQWVTGTWETFCMKCRSKPEPKPNPDKKIALDLAIKALSAPPQLTEEEVEKILPKKIDVSKLISTNEEQWERRYDLGYNQAILECRQALIGK